MDVPALLKTIDANDLVYEASALIAWELGAVSSAEEVANFMYYGGPFLPTSGVNKTTSDGGSSARSEVLGVREDRDASIHLYGRQEVQSTLEADR